MNKENTGNIANKTVFYMKFTLYTVCSFSKKLP